MSARTILKHLYEEGRMTEAQYQKIDRNLKERPQWIPCSERLPEPDKFVLICGDEGDIEVAKGYVSTEIEEFVWLKSSWRFGEVVAWMPLPEPYKKGETNG